MFTAIGLPPDVPSPKSMIVASHDDNNGKKIRKNKKMSKKNIKMKKKTIKTEKKSVKLNEIDGVMDITRVSRVVDTDATCGAPNVSVAIQKGSTINDIPFDGIIFLGDFNYRVNLPRFEIESYKNQLEKVLKRNNISFSIPITQRINDMNYGNFYSILRHDQLLREVRRGNVFAGFHEGKINFLPTFKYDKGCNSFDTSKKSRNPAWTDRILFAQSDKNCSNSSIPFIEQTTYASIDNRHSDHRPVLAQYKIYY